MGALSSAARHRQVAVRSSFTAGRRSASFGLVILGSVVGGLTSGCGDGAGPTEGRPPPPVLSSYGAPLPLPECGSLGPPCDVRAAACATELAALAACLRGDPGAASAPPFTFLTEAAAESYLEGRLQTTPRPDPDRLEIALTQLGLTVPRAFAPAQRAATFAAGWTAFYRSELGDVAVIEHPNDASGSSTALDQPQLEALVLHELIHALQDRDRGLTAFTEAYEQDSDGTLRGMSLIEGEADWYEQRFYAALSGLDVTQIDWRGYFTSRREGTEAWLFAQADLYSSTLLRVPYSHGASYVYGIWAASGPDAVRALLDTPPPNMREVLASSWGETPVEFVAAPDPGDVPTGFERAVQTTLGAWNLYLLARPLFASADPARQLALSWRSDRLDVFSYDETETAARWTLDLADADSATQLTLELASNPRLHAQHSGHRIQIVTASTDPPPTSLTTPQ
jgi:hypothetical protein